MNQFEYEEGNIEDIGNEENPIQTFRNRTRELEQKQELLKADNIRRDAENKRLYEELYKARKDLLSLQHQQYNSDSVDVDLGVFLEFEELKKIIKTQNKKIETLKEQIARQGLASSINNKEYIDIKQKISQLEREIQFSRKFTSTQYFRHYLQLPSMFKVCFEQVKLQHERKTKVKQQLEAEKAKYQQMKNQISRQIQEKSDLYNELMGELHRAD